MIFSSSPVAKTTGEVAAKLTEGARGRADPGRLRAQSPTRPLHRFAVPRPRFTGEELEGLPEAAQSG
jgi:hypothetical protein